MARESGVSKLRVEFLVALATTALLGNVVGFFAFLHSWGGWAFTGAYLMPFVVTGLVGWTRIETDHAHRRLGLANGITIARLGVACLLFGLVADISLSGRGLDVPAAWTVAGLAFAGIVLDGIDGWIARRRGVESDFGARLDMEVDAFLILALSVLAWQLDKAGLWVVLLGVMRYLFWMAGLVLPRFAAPLPASFRRKAACVIAGIVLTVLMAPVALAPLSMWLAGAALVILGYSFLVDSLWLAHPPPRSAGHRE
jgi:phosphatidylglycerophosphate synthase